MQLHWTQAELLASHDVVEPLVAGGVRCHGGFDEQGRYVSPRTRGRQPAIKAWQTSHRAQFGTEILDAPLDTWPDAYPSVEQTKLLLREGVRTPTITALTRIGTVEGFGGLIREVSPGDLQRFFVESVDGTCIGHLDGGMFEAHARDESGYEGEGGHREMWFAARDIAFEHPVSDDETATMLERMGIGTGGGGFARAAVEAVAPEIDPALEAMLRRMIGLLFIEISAFHVFAWAEEVLADDELVAGEGEAARIVSCIRSDETPHVHYLETALTEMRDRTFVTVTGSTVPGVEVIGRLWDLHLADSLGPRRTQARRTFLGELEHALGSHRRRADILERFHALDPAGAGEVAATP
jgi:hypothetical protein